MLYPYTQRAATILDHYVTALFLITKMNSMMDMFIIHIMVIMIFPMIIARMKTMLNVVTTPPYNF